MRRLFRTLVALSIAVLPAATDASAQTLSLDVRDGLVSLDARNVPVRDVLRKWADETGATLVNLDKLQGGTISLQLSSVPEREALRTILRGLSGYVIMAKPEPGGDAASLVDRIVFVASGTAPQTTTPGTALATNAGSPAAASAVVRGADAAALGIDPRKDVDADDEQREANATGAALFPMVFGAPGTTGGDASATPVATGVSQGTRGSQSVPGGFAATGGGTAPPSAASPFASGYVPSAASLEAIREHPLPAEYAARLLDVWDENGRRLVGPTPEPPPPSTTPIGSSQPGTIAK